MDILTTHVYREIHEQPAVLKALLINQREAIARLAHAIKQRQITHVVIAARGTSDNAGRYAQYLLGAKNRLVVALTTPSLFTIYDQPPRFYNALVLGISQSGKSPDIVAVLAEAQRQGALTAAITNEPDSDLAQQAEHVIELHAGKEQAVAATKTYTAELAAIAMLSVELAGDRQMQLELERLPAAVEQTLALQGSMASQVQRYRYMRDCVVIGRGYNYATAFELALKLKEMTYTVVEPYSSADFLHGPLAVLEPGFPVITIAPSGIMLAEMAEFIQTIKRRQAEVLCISDDLEVLKSAITHLPLTAGVPEWLSPLTAILPGQLFTAHLANARGFNLDQPRAIQKVTETR